MTRQSKIKKQSLPRARSLSAARNAAIKDEQRQRACDMFLKGATLQETAARLGITNERVRELLDEATDLWKRKAAKDMIEYRAIELAKIDLLESTAWKAWRRSKRDQVSESYKCTNPTDAKGDESPEAKDKKAADLTAEVAKMLRQAAKIGVKVNAKKRLGKKPEFRDEVYDEAALWRKLANEIEFKKQTRDGNPVFLSIIIKCQERRAEMLGLDEAKRFAGLLEFRVAGSAQEELDRQMLELVAERLSAAVQPSGN